MKYVLILTLFALSTTSMSEDTNEVVNYSQATNGILAEYFYMSTTQSVFNLQSAIHDWSLNEDYDGTITVGTNVYVVEDGKIVLKK